MPVPNHPGQQLLCRPQRTWARPRPPRHPSVDVDADRARERPSAPRQLRNACVSLTAMEAWVPADPIRHSHFHSLVLPIRFDGMAAFGYHSLLSFLFMPKFLKAFHPYHFPLIYFAIQHLFFFHFTSFLGFGLWYSRSCINKEHFDTRDIRLGRQCGDEQTIAVMYETDGHELSHYEASKKQRRGGKQTDRRMDVVCLYCSTCDWIWNWDTFFTSSYFCKFLLSLGV